MFGGLQIMDNNTQQNDEKVLSNKTNAHAWGKLVISLLICYFIPTLGAVFLFLGPVLIPANPYLGTGIGELAAGLITVLAVVLLGGKKLLRFTAQGLRHGFLLSWPFLAADAVLVVLSVVRMLQTGGMIENALPALLGVFVYCMGIGLFEESNFRGLMLNGLLAPLGKSRNWVMICVITSSLWFGRVHVGRFDLTDTTAVIMAVLKILQAGCFGVIMSALVLRTRELGGAILVHVLHDFMLMAMAVLAGGQAKLNYVDSSVGSIAFVAYGILLAVILPPAVLAIRSLLRDGGEDHGAFVQIEEDML